MSSSPNPRKGLKRSLVALNRRASLGAPHRSAKTLPFAETVPIVIGNCKSSEARGHRGCQYLVQAASFWPFLRSYDAGVARASALPGASAMMLREGKPTSKPSLWQAGIPAIARRLGAVVPVAAVHMRCGCHLRV